MNDKLAQAYQKNSSEQFQNGLKLFTLAFPKSNEIVLDVGCGTGALTYQFAKAVLPKGQVIAIDPDNQRIKIAIDNTPSELINIIWKNIPAEEYQSPSKHYFDIIYANSLLWMNF